MVDVCPRCGFPVKEHEQGDGPAFFGILIIGTLTGIFASVVEIKYAPPFWLHAVLWVPFIFIGSLVCIRLFKAMLISAQYRLRREDFGQGHDG